MIQREGRHVQASAAPTRVARRALHLSRVATLVLVVLAVTCASLVASLVSSSTPAHAATLPPRFSWIPQPSGQDANQLTDFAFLPAGGLLSTGKSGSVRYVAPDGTSREILKLTVNDQIDLGLLTIALTNDYEVSGQLYLFYSYDTDTGVVSRLSRWTVDDTEAPNTLGNEEIILDGIALNATAHAGGEIVVDSDDTLWVSIGDGATFFFADPFSLQAQDIHKPQGKILHINPDGSGVSTNPFYMDSPPDEWVNRVYAYGLREPYRMILRPSTGTLYAGEVGWNGAEEINVIRAGMNYGWPCWEGAIQPLGHLDTPTCQELYANPPDNLVDPIWAYEHLPTIQSAIVLGFFVDNATYPAEYQGSLFFADYGRQLMWTLTTDGNDALARAPEANGFASEIGQASAVRQGPGGDVYLGDYSSGSIWRLQYTPNAIVEKYTSLGGASSFLGATVGPEIDVAGGRQQRYQNGTISWSGTTGAHEAHGAIGLRYDQAGGPASGLGFPLTDETPTFLGLGRYNAFEHGSIHWSPATGAHDTRGFIRDKWAALGWELGFLGFPTSNDASTIFGTGAYNHFQGGSIYWSPATGAHEVHGLIRSKWSALGWEFGFLGFPVSDEYQPPGPFGRVNDFQGGSIYWSPSTGAHEVHGAIRNLAWFLGGPASVLGYPRTDETPTLFGTGRYNHFQGGSIYWSPATGAHEVHGAIRDKWAALRWEFGFLGFPTSSEMVPPGPFGAMNTFQGGSIYWSPGTGAHEVHGAILALYESLGGPTSSLGYPISDERNRPNGPGRFSQFEHGTIEWTPSGGAHVTS